MQRFPAIAMLVVPCALTCLSAWLGMDHVIGQEPSGKLSLYKQFEEADQLAQDGKNRDAFLKCIQIPGGDSSAIALVRGNPDVREYLDLLRTNIKSLNTASAKLVEGELLLMLKDRPGALACYREAAAHISKLPMVDSESGLLPRGEYFVECPEPAMLVLTGGLESLLPPFTMGPGSHRDNRLIRRFIAMEAWEDAAREFARIWELHREAARPYVKEVPVWDMPAQPKTDAVADALHPANVYDFPLHHMEKKLFHPVSFNGQGLQFALDYAFFLHRRDAHEAAEAVLLEPLLAIDMDRNPNIEMQGETIAGDKPLPAPERPAPRTEGFWRDGRTSGVSRKEFVRLVYGDYQSRGRSPELVKVLNDRIEAGENRLRRTLALIRGHQGFPDDTMALELAFIAAAKLDLLSMAYRRGLVFDDARKVPQATAEFEAALALPLPEAESVSLPDSEEETSDTGHQFDNYHHWQHRASMKEIRPAIIKHLLHLYTAQGLTDKLLDVTLKQVEYEPHRLYQVDSLKEIIHKFRAAGKENQATAWIQKQLNDAKEPYVIASLAWVAGDQTRAAKAVAEIVKKQGPRVVGHHEWKERFRQAGAESFKQLLTILVQSNPDDGQSRLELLEMDGRLDGVEAIECLELLLANSQDSDLASWTFFGDREQTRSRARFLNFCDLAYRVMRLYERHGKLDPLRKLGLRIAACEKPFDLLLRPYRSSDSEKNYVASGNACLSLAVQYSNAPADQAELSAALKNSPWVAARNQIARRMSGPWKPGPAQKHLPWANVPAGITPLVSLDNVISLANDDQFVYAGHAWGVVVYTHAGQVVTQIALGDVARQIVVLGAQIWIGTPRGLFRITRNDWTVAHQPLNSEDSSGSNHRPGYSHEVTALAVDGDRLWIGQLSKVHVLNTKSLELRSDSKHDLKFDKPGAVDRIVVDGSYVWAAGEFGIRRWERMTDEWSVVEAPGPQKTIQLVAIVNGIAVGAVSDFNDQSRNQMCRIDRDTLAITPIPIVPLSEQERASTEFESFRRSNDVPNVAQWDSKQTFGYLATNYYLDEKLLQLKSLPVFAFSPWGKAQEKWSKANEKLERELASAAPRFKNVLRMLALHEDSVVRTGVAHDYGWKVLTLPNGTLVAGHRLGRTRYEYPNEERRMWDYSHNDLDAADGGLYFIRDPGREDIPREQRIAVREQSGLPADRVYDVVAIDEHDWMCTARGLVVLNRDGLAVDQFSSLEGVCADRVVGGTALGTRNYFATGWDHSSGGLAVFDRLTSTWTSFHVADGLSTDRLLAVQAEGDHLKLSFDKEQTVGGNHGWRQYPPGTFDPDTKIFTAGGPPARMGNEPPDPRPAVDAMPYLGGFVLQRQTLHGRTSLCGTRGVILVDDKNIQQGALPELAIQPLGARPTTSVTARQLADAKSRKPVINNLADVTTALQDENPFFRANALALLHERKNVPPGDYVPLIASCLDSPNRRLRACAVAILTDFNDNDLVVPLLQARLKETDRVIRSEVLLDLVRRGVIPHLELLQQFFREEDHFEVPIGADSSIKVKPGIERMWIALAPLASKQIFELLIENVPRTGHQFDKSVLRQLGQSLIKNPDALDVLLAVRATAGRYDQRVEFVRNVLHNAGPMILPALHAKLQSEDRVIRSNAARGCGAIHDPSSIEPLIKALDLESGLSRASIVWALGELKAKAALSILTRMYVEARNDEQGSRAGFGAGFRASQAGSFTAGQYEKIRSFDSIGDDWKNFDPPHVQPVVDPRQQEELLERRHILETVEKIGPADAQQFYRGLVGESDLHIRREAAIQLAASKTEQEQNIPVLKSLLTDERPEVSLASAASLLILGQPEGRQPLQDALKSHDWGHALKEMERLTPTQYAFARKELETLSKNSTVSEYGRTYSKKLLEAKAK